MHVQQVFIVYDYSRTFKVSWTCSRVYGMLPVSWGLLGALGDRLGRLWAVLDALGAQEWSKSAPRADQEQPKSAIFENHALPAAGA